MDAKRKRRSPSNTTQPATQLSLLPDDIGKRKQETRGARLSQGPKERLSVTYTVDQAGRNLEQFLKRMSFTAEEWELRRNHYLREPRSEEELRSLTWKVEKKLLAGAAIEVALERQKKLSPDLWMVAFLMADGVERTVMPLIIHLKQRRVDMLIAELRSIVRNELHADTDSDGAVTRWFLGL